ncbi:MAG: hypothetical protein ACYDCH_01545 [Gaiellaceae bacterium]
MNSLGALVDRLPIPQRLLLASGSAYAVVFTLVAVWGRPGLGLGQVFYVPIVLAALATGPVGGAAAGASAFMLYELALVFPARIALDGVSAAPGEIRLASYVLAGAVAGYVATRGRAMLAAALHVLDELLIAGRRDLETGAATTVGLERSIGERLSSGRPFVLLVGEPAEPEQQRRPRRPRGADEPQLRKLAGQIAAAVLPGDELARIGPRRFAVLSSVPESFEVAAWAAACEDALGGLQCETLFAAAACPNDGSDLLTLYGLALERLQHRVAESTERHRAHR